MCWVKNGYINKFGELVYKTDKYHTDFANGSAFVGNSLIDLKGNTIIKLDNDKEFLSYAPVLYDALLPVAINRNDSNKAVDKVFCDTYSKRDGVLIR